MPRPYRPDTLNYIYLRHKKPMTTLRIEEMVENVIEQIPRYCLTNKIGFDALKEDRQGAFGDISELDLVLEKALTKAYQAGRDEEVAREILSHFSYEDWDIGNDDKLRVGDYINLNYQRGHDGYEQNLQGKIVLHDVNKFPVILYNIDPETKDEEESGDYGDIQSFFMDGWTFSRIQALNDTIKPLQDNK